MRFQRGTPAQAPSTNSSSSRSRLAPLVSAACRWVAAAAECLAQVSSTLACAPHRSSLNLYFCRVCDGCMHDLARLRLLPASLAAVELLPGCLWCAPASVFICVSVCVCCLLVHGGAASSLAAAASSSIICTIIIIASASSLTLSAGGVGLLSLGGVASSV